MASAGAGGAVLRRQLDRELGDVGPSRAIVRRRRVRRLLLGECDRTICDRGRAGRRESAPLGGGGRDTNASVPVFPGRSAAVEDNLEMPALIGRLV